MIKQFSGTRTADLVHAYASISYNHIENNKKALEHLNKFRGGDLLVTPAVTGAIGDVYMNMGETDKAIAQFLKAAKASDDTMLTPIYYKKAGEAYLAKADYDKALDLFKRIKEEYLNAPEAQEAEKFIQQVKILKGAK